MMDVNDAALEQALGAPPPPAGDPMLAGSPGECPLCTGPVDPETGMTLAPPAMPDAPPAGGMPPLPPGMV